MISARRSYLDLIFKAAGFGFVSEYYDVLSKFNFKLDNQNSLNFLFISAFDNVKYFNETPEQRYDNSQILGSDQVQYFTGLSCRRIFNGGFFNPTHSRNFVDFDTSQKDSLQVPIFTDKSIQAENILRGDLVYKLSANSEVKFKFTFSTVPPLTPYNSDGSQSVSLYNTERLAPYYALDVRIDRRWYFDKWTLITYLDIQNITNRKNSTSVK